MSPACHKPQTKRRLVTTLLERIRDVFFFYFTAYFKRLSDTTRQIVFITLFFHWNCYVDEDDQIRSQTCWRASVVFTDVLNDFEVQISQTCRHEHFLRNWNCFRTIRNKFELAILVFLYYIVNHLFWKTSSVVIFDSLGCNSEIEWHLKGTAIEVSLA